MLTFDFNKIDIPQDARVLDLGCGEGRHIFGIMEKFPNVELSYEKKLHKKEVF